MLNVQFAMILLTVLKLLRADLRLNIYTPPNLLQVLSLCCLVSQEETIAANGGDFLPLYILDNVVLSFGENKIVNCFSR